MQVHSPDYESSVRCCRNEGKTYSDCGATLESPVKNDEESMQFESETENVDSALEEDKRSGDSLSSSISMTDSDISSPEDCDSLDLSESESITDVTPLNSPYCDSPLPHARCSEQKYKDVSQSGQSIDSRNDATFLAKSAPDQQQPNTGEMNLIISAIQKLEFERGQNIRSERHFSVNKRKNCACGNEDGRRPDQENQHLFKRIISQQNRGKVYSLQPQYAHKTCSSNRYRQHRHADSDSALLLKKFQPSSSNKIKDSCRTHSHRQQKCLSHPSSYAFAETEAIAKMSSSGSSPKSLCNSASDASSPDASASSQGAMYDAKTLCSSEDMGTVDFSEEMSIH